MKVEPTLLTHLRNEHIRMLWTCSAMFILQWHHSQHGRMRDSLEVNVYKRCFLENWKYVCSSTLWTSVSQKLNRLAKCSKVKWEAHQDYFWHHIQSSRFVPKWSLYANTVTYIVHHALVWIMHLIPGCAHTLQAGQEWCQLQLSTFYQDHPKSPAAKVHSCMCSIVLVKSCPPHCTIMVGRKVYATTDQFPTQGLQLLEQSQP